MAIARANNSILKVISGGGMTPIKGTVELFGKTYSTIKINGLEWICENLDYKWDGLIIEYSYSTSPHAVYVDNDESLWGWNSRKCGLLYNYEAKNYINNILSDGWRVPSILDLYKLTDSVIDFVNAGTKLAKAVDWSSLGGTNTIGFSELPCGAMVDNAMQDENNGYYIHLNENYRVMAYCRSYNVFPTAVEYGNYFSSWFLPIRLCRNT